MTLDTRIRQLCAQSVATKDEEELRPIMRELRDALHEHTEDLKLIVGEYPFLDC
jgi:hypothetical protein